MPKVSRACKGGLAFRLYKRFHFWKMKPPCCPPFDLFQFQEQILTGQIPCSRDEAACLASIQLCVEDQWPNNKRRYTIHRQILRGQFGKLRELTQKIMVTPWEVDQSVYTTVSKHVVATPPPNLSVPAIQLPGAPGGGPSTSGTAPGCTALVADAAARGGSLIRRHRRLFGSCILGRSGGGKYAISDETLTQCLPPEYHDNKRVAKLIKVR